MKHHIRKHRHHYKSLTELMVLRARGVDRGGHDGASSPRARPVLRAGGPGMRLESIVLVLAFGFFAVGFVGSAVV